MISSIFGMTTYSADNGYLEALVQGYKSTLLTQSQYGNMAQCESLDDVRLQLCATDYQAQFQNQDGARIRSRDFGDGCMEHLVLEFKHLRAAAVQPLAQFLDLITAQYMIDNLVLLITGTLH